MEAKFSNRVKEVIALSREEAIRLHNDYIGVEHLFLAIIREGNGYALDILSRTEVAIEEVILKLEKSVERKSSGSDITSSIPITKQYEKILKMTYLEAKAFKSDIIGTEHLLLSTLKDKANNVSKILNKFKIDYESVKRIIKTDIDNNIRHSIDTHEKIESKPLGLPNNSTLLLEFEIPEHLSDEDALQMIKESVLLADQSYRANGGSGLKINDIRIAEFKPELVEE